MPVQSQNQAGSLGRTERNRVLVDLLSSYEDRLRGLFRSRYRHDADDVFQEFVRVVLIERRLVDRLHASRKTPSSQLPWPLLKKAAKDYAVDWYRQRAARVRAERHAPIASEPVPTTDGETIEWARRLVVDAVKRVRDHFVDTDQADHWTVFAGRLLMPILRGTTPIPVGALIRSTNFSDVEEVYNALHYGKRVLRKQLISDICEKAPDSMSAVNAVLVFRDLLEHQERN